MGRQHGRGLVSCRESGAKRHLCFFFFLPRALAPLLPVGGATRTENGVDSGAKGTGGRPRNGGGNNCVESTNRCPGSGQAGGGP
ncbi:uncharacterized protein B0T23DRAFT_383044 [Neurospora hispaniola]|uniref:Uncharacterized protein n=1 Tax=Neurospora hispaniola TaxID=588809 RepID=A0AAJ0I6D4_9PEZI|nr:hypothetical protein B0T23DRAFT_383044 [Neurospora hispaniola]